MYNKALKHPVSKLSALSVAVSCLTGAPLPAMGQQLEEIMVTATRRVESLQDVPLAVSAMSGESLANAGAFETSDMNRIAPNLQVSSPYGQAQPNFSIRGVGVGTEFNANAASPVGVYVDEVYQTFRASHGQQLYDLEQVEIVRGPQGTLFGRNTTGGTINFITNKPDLAETTGYATVGYGNYDRIHAEGAIEFTPVQDVFGVRIAGTYVDVDPYVENELPKGLSTAAAGGASGLNFNSGKDPGGIESWGVRANFRWMPSDDLDMNFKIYAAESDGGTENAIPTGQSKNNDVIDYTHPNFLLSPLFSQLAPAGLLPDSYSQKANGLDTREIEVDSVGDLTIEAEGVVFSMDYAINDSLSFIGIFGYDSGKYGQDPTTDCDASPLALCTIGYNSDFDAFNVDVRFDYTGENLQLIVGAFYGEDNLEGSNKPNFFNFTRDINAAFGSDPSYFNPGGALLPGALPTGITATNDFEQDRESYAIYGEANYQFTETLGLTVGLRYSDDELEFSEGITTYYDDAGTARLLTVSDYTHPATGEFAPYFLQDVYDAAGNLAIPAAIASPGPRPGPLELKDGSDDVSGRIIIDWTPFEDAMFYASYSRGYRAGTINGLAYGSANQVYFVPPEEVDAYEFGWKSQLLDNTLQFNGAIFYYDYQGQQGQVVDNTATANLISFDGEITGAEVELMWLATEDLTFTAAVGWLDSEYDDADCPEGDLTGFPAQEGNCVQSSAGPVSVGGNPFPFAAEYTANLGMDWYLAEIGEGTVLLHADAAYTDQFYYDSFEEYTEGPLPNVAAGKFAEGEGDYWVYNARLSYQTDNYQVALWGKNLTDEEYYPYGISIENLFGNGYRIMGPPRTYGIEFRYNF